jgi:hypothetical protein
MSLPDTLREALARTFPGAYVTGGWADDAVATFPAKHEAVGDLVVAADDEEVTIYAGAITHGHFNWEYEPTEGVGPDAIVPSVLTFLESLFADRVLLWIGRFNSGGWQVLAPGEQPKKKGKQAFVWSGPIT